MSVTLEGLRPADYSVLALIAVSILACLVAGLCVIPWRTRSRKVPRSRMDNRFWQVRLFLEILTAIWMVTQVLRLSSVWGYGSIVFEDDVTDWSGAGRNCRVYLTAALGVLHPLCALCSLLAFAAVSRLPENIQAVGGWRASGTLLGVAVLFTLPVAAGQAVVAWLSTFVYGSGGDNLENEPHSLLGYFFAAYDIGTKQQCSGEKGCTLCIFPAAAVIIHVLWRAAFLLALWVRARRAVYAMRDDRNLVWRVRAFQITLSILAIAECIAAGASIAFSAFGWANQACWLVFFGCCMAQVFVVGWAVVLRPLQDAHALDKRVAFWNDAAGQGGAPTTPDGGLIRAYAQRSDGVDPSPFGPLPVPGAAVPRGEGLRAAPSFAVEPPPHVRSR